MNLVDTSGWIEYFVDGENAVFFSKPLSKIDELVVSTINIYEIFKIFLNLNDETKAILAVSLMHDMLIAEASVTLHVNNSTIKESLQVENPTIRNIQTVGISATVPATIYNSKLNSGLITMVEVVID